jgi:hypothetical protein
MENFKANAAGLAAILHEKAMDLPPLSIYQGSAIVAALVSTETGAGFGQGEAMLRAGD